MPPVTATFGQDTGGIEGFVLDDEELPIRDVQVGIPKLKDLLGDNATTSSNEEGAFALSNIPPGRYELHFQKIGYIPVTHPVDVVAGQKTPVSQNLARDAAFVLADPFHDFPPPKKGWIGCAVGGVGTYGDSPLQLGKDYCASVDSARSATVKWPKEVGQNLTGLYVSARWSKGSVVTGGNALRINLPITSQENLRVCKECKPVGENRIEGPSGMEAYYDSLDPRKYIVHPDFPEVAFTGFVSNGNTTDPNSWGGVVAQQEFEVAIYLMYNGKTLPDNFDIWGA